MTPGHATGLATGYGGERRASVATAAAGRPRRTEAWARVARAADPQPRAFPAGDGDASVPGPARRGRAGDARATATRRPAQTGDGGGNDGGGGGNG